MTTITFPAPGKLLNLNDRMHWRPRAQLTAMWRQAAYLAAVDAINRGLLERSQPPTTVQCTFPVRSVKVQRDPSNWYPTIKATVDGLTDAGLWPDDTAQWVATVEPAFTKGGPVVIVLHPRAA